MPESDASRKLRIRTLAIKNFRGIDELSLDLTDADGEPLDLVVIGGGNGSGKTAVLEAISLLLTGTTELLAKDSAPLNEQIRFGADGFFLHADLRMTGAKLDRDLQASLNINPVSLFQSKSNKKYASLPDGEKKEVLWGWGGNFPAAEINLEYFSSRREPTGLGAIADIGGDQLTSEADRLRELKRRLVSAYYRDLRAARQGAPSNGSPIKRLQRFWERFDERGWTLDILPLDNNPGSGEEVIVREAGPIPEDITSLAMARALAPTRSDIPQMVPIERLSSGQMELFALAGPLIFRDQPPDIILIDEPEHHMHVQWQRQLLPSLRELAPRSQLIVATHSEAILDAALSYERVLLVKDDDPRARLDTSGDDEAGDEDGANGREARA